MENKEKSINFITSKHTEVELDALEEVVEKLSKKLKRLIKKNGFSKDLKEKVEAEL